MKAILLITASCLVSSFLFGQPVITNTSAPKEGDNFVVQSAGIVDFGPGSAGPNITWDFSGVTPDTITGFAFQFVNPAGVPSAESFPEANLALVVSGAGSSVANSFFIVDDNGIQLIGNSFSDISITTYSDPRSEVMFPLTYQTSFTDEFSSTTNALGMMTPEVGVDSVFVDGYGTLILPDRSSRNSVETFENVLRVRVIRNQTRTTSISGINVETVLRNVAYLWVSPDFSTSLAGHETSSGETRTFLVPGGPPIISPLPEVTSFSWNEHGGTSPVYRVNQEDALDVRWLSSQPVMDEIQISVSSDQNDLMRWGIFDAGGRMITSGKLPLMQKETELTIPYEYSPGLYFIKCNTDKGFHKTIKFVKQ